MRHTLSSCIVVRDGRRSIQRCLASAAVFSDEIVVVDTGSVDGTPELAETWKSTSGYRGSVRVIRSGRKYYDSDGVFDFGAAKNRAIAEATSEYVIWLDVNDTAADPKRVRMAFDDLSGKAPAVSIVMLTRTTPTFAFPRLRIARRSGAEFVGSIHEYMKDNTPGAVRVDTHLEIVNFKKSRNIERNVRGLMKEWKKRHSVRTAFYMSMSMHDLGRDADAEEWRRIVIDEFPSDRSEERFKTMENTCEAYYTAKDWESLGELTLDMMNQFPMRAEGFFYRYIYNFNTGRYSLAYKCLYEAGTKAVPRTAFWLNREIYDRTGIQRRLDEAREYAEIRERPPIVPQGISDTYSYPVAPGPSESGYGTGTLI